MPKNLSSTGATFPTQTSPIAGEPRTAGGIEAALQNAADRTQWAKNRIDHIDPGQEGIRRVRRVASIAALQAITDYPAKTSIMVDGVGIYEFDELSIVAELSPLIIKPTNIVHPAPGRWIVAGAGLAMLNVANGVPQLDGSGKVPGTRLGICDASGRVIGTSVVNGRTQFVTGLLTTPYTIPATITWVDVPGASFQVAMLAGDLLLIDFDPIWSVAAGDKVSGRIRITKPDASNDDSNSSGIGAPAGPAIGQRIAVRRHFTALADGTHTVILQAQGAVANVGTNTVNNIYVRIEAVRP